MTFIHLRATSALVAIAYRRILAALAFATFAVVATIADVPGSLDGEAVRDEVKQASAVQGSYAFATLAGMPSAGSADGVGTAAQFTIPVGVVVDTNGIVYVADSNNSTIRRISATGEVTTLAGAPGAIGTEDGSGSTARFWNPRDLAIGPDGNIYVADSGGRTIRKVTPGGVVSTLAGMGGVGGSTDGTGGAARFNFPVGIAVDSAGKIYVSDYADNTIRVIAPGGAVTTLAGQVGVSGFVNGSGSAARFFSPVGLGVDGVGNVYVADLNNHSIRKVTPAGVVSTAINLGSQLSPRDVAIASNGAAFVTEGRFGFVVKLSSTWIGTDLFGSPGIFGNVDGTGTAARFFYPEGVAVGQDGTAYVTDSIAYTVRKISTTGSVTTLAGRVAGLGDTDGDVSVARFFNPIGVATDANGRIYVADSNNFALRSISPDGIVKTIAQSTEFNLLFYNPLGVAVPPDGAVVYVADSPASSIKKVTGSVVQLFAGVDTVSGSADGTGTSARFKFPLGLAVDPNTKAVYVADYFNHTIRKIMPTGQVTTFAGQAGSPGSADGTGSAARFNLPTGVAVDPSGNVYVTDSVNNTVRKITSAGVVTTFAGMAGHAGAEDGTGPAARFLSLYGIATDSAGTVYVTDSFTVRSISPAGVVTTLAGTAGVAGNADGIGAAVRFSGTHGIAVDPTGRIIVADSANHTIRVGAPPVAPTITSNPQSQTVALGKQATVKVVAAGFPLTYQWYLGTSGTTSSPIAGATGSTYTIPSVTATTSLWVRVSNSLGSVDSESATVSTPPTMSLDKTSLRFGATTSGNSFTQQTQGQSVRLLQTGAGTVTWTASASHPWLTVSPRSGTGSADLTIGVTPASSVPASGSVNGSITITLTGAANTVGPISVTLRTFSVASSTAPTGAFDTPLNGATGITGSIAVSGWAVDDVEVRAVRIMRDPIAGEGSAQVFIGNAVFVDGARPDVANGNSTAPRNTRAGWGYLMLTNFLPNRGNGTFKIYAYADDADGHTTLLGTRTITCTNDAATKPFGAIDRPEQGETIGGSTYPNFGWVLARGSRADPPGGGTVTVYIDGVAVGTPGAWSSRADLTSLFPVGTYPGVGTALAVFGLNTTTLTNGVHTIYWVVTGANTQTDGIGSRYITVVNGAALRAEPGDGSYPAAAGNSLVLSQPPLASPPPADIDAARLDLTSISGRRGYDPATPLRSYAVDSAGRITVDGEELDRFELQLGASGYTGYTRAGDELRPLPIGSHLEPAAGTFTWHPGVGFVHAYDLVFVRCASDGCSRREIRFVLHPEGSRVGPQIVIDTPSATENAAALEQPFLLAGWAVDLDAAVGTGVDAVHVWAYPVSACGPREDSESSSAAARASGGGAPLAGDRCDDPTFVGAATYGGVRPDVGTVFGEQFAPSGYGISIDGLVPGTYDLAVFAWSSVKGGFVPAKVVRVTVK